MLKFVNKLFKSNINRHLKSYSRIVNKINDFEKSIQNLSDNDLKAKTDYFKNLINEGSSLDDILVEAFAVVREVSKRTINLSLIAL